jgi:putative methanogenesis marker protein 8
MTESDIHIIEAIGKTRIVVKDGEVVECGEPQITSCPLARRFSRPVATMTPPEIQANIEERIRTIGFCTKDREVTSTDDFVLFGASELLSSGIRAGTVDAAVIVCEGAGTVIATSPELVQGIGGRMSGLIRTSPIPAVIERIQAHHGRVIDPAGATIDQPAGVGEAVGSGMRRVAVTVADSEAAETIRNQYPETLIIGVHLTGIPRGEAERMVAACDIVSACASREIREAAKDRALVQGGVAVPVFAMTARGKELILDKIRATSRPVLIRSARLPEEGPDTPVPLR